MKNHYLKGHDVAAALAAIGEVEGRIDTLPAGSRASRFQRLGPWLLERGFLISLLRHGARAMPAVPGLSGIGAFRLAKALLSPALVRSTCRAQAVHFKEGARAFYLLPKSITVKLSSSPASQRGFANEIEARRLAAGELRCPRLIDYELESTPCFMCEEMIDGRRPDRSRDRELVIDFVLNPLWSYYESRGFELVRCSDLYDLGALLSGVRAAAAAEREWDPAWLERGRFLDEIQVLGEERDRYVPCCMGHGDLSDGNMIVGNDDGAIYLVDWERARKLPVVHELRKIFLQYAGSWDLLAPRLGSLTGGRPASQIVPLARQALLDVLAQIVEFQRWSPASQADARQRKAVERKRSHLLRREFASASRLLSHGTY